MCELDLPPSSCPVNSKHLSHCGMLDIGVDFGLHVHQLGKNFGISVVLKRAVLLDACDHILVNTSLQPWNSISTKSIQRLVLTAVAARQTTDLGTSCEKTSGK